MRILNILISFSFFFFSNAFKNCIGAPGEHRPKIRVKSGYLTTTYVLQSSIEPPPRTKRKSKNVEQKRKLEYDTSKKLNDGNYTTTILSKTREMKNFRRKSIGACLCS